MPELPWKWWLVSMSKLVLLLSLTLLTTSIAAGADFNRNQWNMYVSLCDEPGVGSYRLFVYVDEMEAEIGGLANCHSYQHLLHYWDIPIEKTDYGYKHESSFGRLYIDNNLQLIEYHDFNDFLGEWIIFIASETCSK